MIPYILEACADSAESAVLAAAGGADRFELCQNLVIGGTTPTPGLFHAVQSRTDLPIRVLVRPRFGDFLYTEAELEAMESDIRYFRDSGAPAIVCGVLDRDGRLNLEAMKRLRDAAGPLEFTLHRAFDMSRDPLETLEDAIGLGIDTILTSGQAPTALEGAAVLKTLQDKAAGRITLLAGSGISAGSITRLHELTGITAYHMSGKSTLDSGMRFRHPQVSMGLPGLSEYEIWLADEQKFRDARAALDRIRQH